MPKIKWASIRQHLTYDNGVTALLVVYAVMLAIESSVSVATAYWLKWLEAKIVLVLCIDILWRLYSNPRKELRSFWWWLDVITTVLAFVPGYEALRALRLIQLLSRKESTRLTLEELIRAIRTAGDELLIAGVLIAVNALIGHRAFAEVLPERFAEVPDALLASTFLALIDDLWTVYSVAFEANALVAFIHLSISLGTTLFIVSKIVWRVFEAHKT
jgi:Ion transport protein